MLGIIINPKSGKKAFRAQRLYLWKLLKARREPFIYRVTKYENHAIELARELVEEKACTKILILGGDGTLSEVINGIMRAELTPEQRANIKFGLMPRGTGNDFARHWGLNKDFKRSLDIFFQGYSKPIDVGFKLKQKDENFTTYIICTTSDTSYLMRRRPHWGILCTHRRPHVDRRSHARKLFMGRRHASH